MNHLPPVDPDDADSADADPADGTAGTDGSAADGTDATDPRSGAGPAGDAGDAPTATERYRLPPHAHVVVYDRRERDLVTVYDCGAAQKPPSAQFLGHLVRVDADAELVRGPTGYTASLREPALLERQGEDRWVVRADDG